MLVVVFLDDRKAIQFHDAYTDYEEGDVGILGKDAGVGNNLDRRTVEEDIVVLSSYLVDELCKAIVGDKLGGVWRQGTNRKNEEIAILASGNDYIVPVVNISVDIVGDSLLGFVDIGGQ